MLEYVAGTNKGGVVGGYENPDVFNSVYHMGEMNQPRMDYTGQAVADTIVDGQAALAWNPVCKGAFGKYDIKINRPATATEAACVLFGVFADGKQAKGEFDGMTYFNEDGTAAATTVMAGDSVAYKYDNVVIPQKELPILNARLASVQLTAHARRIAIYFSQIAAFQAKTDYGFDLGDQLADQAIGELGYEIDSEIVAGLCDAAPFDKKLAWPRMAPVGVSKMEHYQGFAEVVEMAKAIVYKATQKLNINCA